MIQITQENIDDLKMNGIIVSVPKNPDVKDGSHTDIGFIVECSYHTDGTSGYPNKGTIPDTSSFYNVSYNTDYLPNGLFFNSTTRLTKSHIFSCMNRYNFYKFKDLQEFCEWYLEYIKSIKQITRRDKLNDVIKLLEFQTKLQRTLDAANTNFRDLGMCDLLEKQYQRDLKELNDWLDEKV